MNFVDEKGQKDYEYLSASLSEAVSKSLKEKFTYQTTSSVSNEKALAGILKGKKKKNKDLNLIDIQTLAKKQNLDVVIYGEFFAHHQKGTETSIIFIKTRLYLRFFWRTHYSGRSEQPHRLQHLQCNREQWRAFSSIRYLL